MLRMHTALSASTLLPRRQMPDAAEAHLLLRCKQWRLLSGVLNNLTQRKQAGWVLPTIQEEEDGLLLGETAAVAAAWTKGIRRA
mmetsp:Transcript_53621/g.109322  ORF Transcript_53621/g.109322 Transcript_53621/m.109322 type:complete len:84 (+) Transcript_53621:793-1044(+)